MLSPTRTYAPLIKKIFEEIERKKINGIIHCSGGAQTKILHFVDKLHIIKNNLFDPPPVFKLIQEESGTSWKEMYQVFNMGHRMEIYTDISTAEKIINISKKEINFFFRCFFYFLLTFRSILPKPYVLMSRTVLKHFLKKF